jgi:protein TonB
VAQISGGVSVVDESGPLRTMTRAVFLSCLLHLGLAGGFTLIPPWVGAVRPPTLPVELITLDAPVEPPRNPPPSPPPRERIQPPRRVERPRLIEAPRPAEPSHAVEEPPAVPSRSRLIEEPAPSAQPVPGTPGPAESGQTQAVASTPEPAPATSSVVGVPSSAGDGLPAPLPPPVANPPRRDAAATEGLTRVARPQGGYQVRPAYPSAARRLGIQGTTLLRVHVLADGRIGDVVVEKSAGHMDLDQSATEAVRQWRFEPARRGDEPVAMWVLLPVEFRLR